MPHLPSLLLLSYYRVMAIQFLNMKELGGGDHSLVGKEVWGTGFEAAFTEQNEIFFRLSVTN